MRAGWVVLGLAAAFGVGVVVGQGLKAGGSTQAVGGHRHVSVQGSGKNTAALTTAAGLPMWPNDLLIPVWTVRGRPQYLDASQAPVVIFAAKRPGAVKRLVRAIGKLPVQLVAARFSSGRLVHAEKTLSSLEAQFFPGRTVYALQGPYTTFATRLPVLVYQGVWAKVGQSVPVRGLTSKSLQAIYARTAAALVHPKV